VGSQTWLQIHSEGGQAQGWVLDDPSLVIHREVKQYSDPQGVFSILYPASWSAEQGNPAVFTAPNGDPQAGILKIQTGNDISNLPPLPMSPGHEAPVDEPTQPIEVSGVTAFIAVYKSDDGGWEYAVEKKIGNHVVLFDFQQPRSAAPDLTLYRQLLTSATVQ
jgi:hypothetical protein